MKGAKGFVHVVVTHGWLDTVAQPPCRAYWLNVRVVLCFEMLLMLSTTAYD